MYIYIYSMLSIYYTIGQSRAGQTASFSPPAPCRLSCPTLGGATCLTLIV